MIVSLGELMPVIRGALRRGQRVRLQADGASMLPFIHSGDTVELEPPAGVPRFGDIVLAEAGDGTYVVHRVVRVEGGRIYLRGDAQAGRSVPVTAGGVLGRVVLSRGRGRVRRHDSGLWHCAGRAWVLTGPPGHFALKAALFLHRFVRSAPVSYGQVRGSADDRIKKTVDSWNNLGWDYDAFIARSAPERMQAIDAPLLAQCRSNDRVLEIGCGTARLRKAVKTAGGRYVGLDPSASLLQRGSARGGRRFVRGAGEYLPFRDGSFDVVIGGYCSFRYIQLDKLYPECGRVLRPGGIMAFTLWNGWALLLASLIGMVSRLGKPGPLWTACATCNDVFRPGRERRRLEKAGFSVMEMLSTRRVPLLGKVPLARKIFGWQGYWKGRLGAVCGYDVIVICRNRER